MNWTSRLRRACTRYADCIVFARSGLAVAYTGYAACIGFCVFALINQAWWMEHSDAWGPVMFAVFSAFLLIHFLMNRLLEFAENMLVKFSQDPILKTYRP